MTPRNTLTALAVAALTAASPLATFAAAGTQPSYQTQQKMLQTVDEAMSTVARVRAARVALFDNDIAGAKEQLTIARDDFVIAEKGINDLSIGDTEIPDSAVRYLPFDVSFTLAEDVPVTSENAQALQTAYDHAKSGDNAEALTALVDAHVDASVAAALVPVVSGSADLEQAQTYMDEGKYFDANLALKHFEDSIVVRSYSVSAIPQQGQAAAQDQAQTQTN